MKSFVKKLSIFLVVVSFGLNLLWSNEKSLQINPDIKIGTLENGMSYYVMKNSEPKNRIFFRLVVKAGSNLEEDDQKGVAHFVEHLAFNGTENFKKHEIIAFLEGKNIKNKDSFVVPYIKKAIEDSYKRLIAPSVSREVRSEYIYYWMKSKDFKYQYNNNIIYNVIKSLKTIQEDLL